MTNVFYKITLQKPDLFAVSYNCSSYGAGAYDNNQVCGATTTTTTTGGTAGNAGGGSLVDTGVHFVLPIVVGLILICSAAYFFFRKSKKIA